MPCYDQTLDLDICFKECILQRLDLNSDVSLAFADARVPCFLRLNLVRSIGYMLV